MPCWVAMPILLTEPSSVPTEASGADRPVPWLATVVIVAVLTGLAVASQP